MPPEVRAALRAKFGLDDPVWTRYLHWLVAMLQGDWGFSFVSRMDVDTLILQRLPVTLIVIGSSQILAILVALPVGVLAATRPYSMFDQIANTLAFVGFSLPTFFTGLLFILVFSIQLDWLPFVYRADIDATGWQFYWEHIKQSIMPVMVLGLFQGASLVRFVRSSVLDVIQLDYVTTARSKGIGERKVITKHVVRNALIPVVTLVALQMPIVFGGAIVTEQIFRVPGIGSLLISAMLANDTPGRDGRDLRVRLSRRLLQPHRRYPLWLARPPHLLPLTRRRPSRPRRASAARRRRGRRPGAVSAATGWRVASGVVLLAADRDRRAGPVHLAGGDQRDRLRRQAAGSVLGASAGHRRSRPGPAGAADLWRAHLACGRPCRHGRGGRRRRRWSARWPACRAAGSTPP